MPTIPNTDDVALAQLREQLAATGADAGRLATFDRVAPTIARLDGESTQSWSLRTLAAVSRWDCGERAPAADELRQVVESVQQIRGRLAELVPAGDHTYRGEWASTARA
ncbi:hypothetical protein ACGFKZ_30050, partial [Micromonospora tulbaghiae]|uniref:hypothetical protein n=1 Tax=Micromonospora tulbaghiae TaxID=479978 RepID=UPI003718EC4F